MIVSVNTLLAESQGAAGATLLTDGKVNKRIRGKNHHLEPSKAAGERVEAVEETSPHKCTEETHGTSGMPME